MKKQIQKLTGLFLLSAITSFGSLSFGTEMTSKEVTSESGLPQNSKIKISKNHLKTIDEIQGDLLKITKDNVSEKAKEVWSKLLFQGYYKDIFQKGLTKLNETGFYNGLIKEQLGKKQKWVEWRNFLGSDEAGNAITADTFRHAVIGLMTTTISQALKDKLGVTIEWRAIGTGGAFSDVDIVNTCTSCDPNDPTKKRIEIIAKSLFDLLSISEFGDSSGNLLDTESYIDTTADLNKRSENTDLSEQQINLGFLFSQIQVARQLEGFNSQLKDPKKKGSKSDTGIKVDGQLVMNSTNYMNKISKKQLSRVDDSVGFNEIFEEAKNFEENNHPLKDSLQNIGQYIPIINKLSIMFAQEQNSLRQEVIGRTIETFLPEGYFTQQSIVDICYGTAPHSQGFKSNLKEVKKKIQGEPNGINLTGKEIIGQTKCGLIKTTPLDYLISAGENLGYFFHQLDHIKNPFDALRTASKYLQRFARSLALYQKIDLGKDFKKKTSDQFSKYLYELYQLSSNLERAKRRAINLTTYEDMMRIVNNFYNSTSIKAKVIATRSVRSLLIKGHNPLPNQFISIRLWKLFNAKTMPMEAKKDQLDKLISLKPLGIKWNDSKKCYEVDPAHNSQEAPPKNGEVTEIPPVEDILEITQNEKTVDPTHNSQEAPPKNGEVTEIPPVEDILEITQNEKTVDPTHNSQEDPLKHGEITEIPPVEDILEITQNEKTVDPAHNSQEAPPKNGEVTEIPPVEDILGITQNEKAVDPTHNSQEDPLKHGEITETPPVEDISKITQNEKAVEDFVALLNLIVEKDPTPSKENLEHEVSKLKKDGGLPMYDLQYSKLTRKQLDHMPIQGLKAFSENLVSVYFKMLEEYKSENKHDFTNLSDIKDVISDVIKEIKTL
jgi:hypothetical protein